MRYIQETNDLVLSILEREEEQIPSWVCDEIKRYNERAGKRISQRVGEYLERFRPKSPVKLYRALGLHISDANVFLEKSKLEAKVGSEGIYKTGKIQSWSSELKQSEQFAGKFYLGGKDEDSLGIIFSSVVQPDAMFAPLAMLPKETKSECLRYDQDEYLLSPGSYRIKVEKLVGPWDKVGAGDLKSAIKELGKKIADKTDGVYGKNWNKSPGFGIDFPKIFTNRKGNWSPSIQFFVDDDFSTYYEIFGFANRGSDGKKTKKHKDFDALIDYINGQAYDDFLVVFERSKKAGMDKKILANQD